jgi:hypothetical protein
MPVKIQRARVTTSPAKSAPAKKTASKAPATKTAARATPSRARKTAAKPEVKSTPANVKNVRGKVVEVPALKEKREKVNPSRKVAGLTYKQVSELTGYGLGTEQFIAAVEILKGGETKLDVSHRIAALLPAETRNGTPKQVSNLVSGVINTLVRKGFAIEGSWKMVAPSE